MTAVAASTQVRHQRVDGRRGTGGLRWTVLLWLHSAGPSVTPRNFLSLFTTFLRKTGRRT